MPRQPDVDPARSRQMSLVRNRDTKPEMVVRRLVHSMGFRYRLHRRDLPGKPDLVFPGRRKVIFVHGCFWHRHPDPTCWRARLPKSRPEFWIPKLEGNAARDERDIAALEADGWQVLVIWECQTTPRQRDDLRRRIAEFLG
ncbi:very short patch repair endonuclease [Microvirga calopogonii]|uniref:very short patch repair endonuclease n=1 Tax=Microvirga calopogonii TaxID=2078013 RepID=UPI001FDEA800|nr:very short patch repair endonuclease [Microvirga calopogonii]